MSREVTRYSLAANSRTMVPDNIAGMYVRFEDYMVALERTAAAGQTRAIEAERETARWRRDLAELLWKLGPAACALCEGRWWVGEQPCTCAGGRLAADGGWPVGGSVDEGGVR